MPFSLTTMGIPWRPRPRLVWLTADSFVSRAVPGAQQELNVCIFLEQRKWKNKWKHEQCRGRRKGLTYILIARVVAWNSPNLTTCFVADCYIKYWLSRREKRNDDGIWSCLLEGKSWKQIIFGVRRKWIEKAYKLLGSRTNTHVIGQAELHSDPRTKGSQFKLWKGLFQKAAGQNFLTRRALNVWEKGKSKTQQAKAAKGVISVNSLRFLSLSFL